MPELRLGTAYRAQLSGLEVVWSETLRLQLTRWTERLEKRSARMRENAAEGHARPLTVLGCVDGSYLPRHVLDLNPAVNKTLILKCVRYLSPGSSPYTEPLDTPYRSMHRPTDSTCYILHWYIDRTSGRLRSATSSYSNSHHLTWSLSVRDTCLFPGLSTQ